MENEVKNRMHMQSQIEKLNMKVNNLDNFVDFLCDKFNADREEMEEKFQS